MSRNIPTAAGAPMPEITKLQDVRASLARFARRHALGIGIGEIVAGGALIAYGIHVLDPMLVAQSMAAMAPGASSLAFGGTAAAALLKVGGIGVAALGAAFAVPGGALAAAGVILFGALGYSVGSVIKELLDPTLQELLTAYGPIALGILLIADGLRRLRQSPRLSAQLDEWAALSKHAIRALVRRALQAAKSVLATLAGYPNDWREYQAAVLERFRSSPLPLKALMAPSALVAYVFG
jgi:hypothetical protein